MLCNSKVKAGMQMGSPRVAKVSPKGKDSKTNLQTSTRWQNVTHGPTFLTILVERRHGNGGETGPVLEGNLRDEIPDSPSHVPVTHTHTHAAHAAHGFECF